MIYISAQLRLTFTIVKAHIGNHSYEALKILFLIKIRKPVTYSKDKNTNTHFGL